MTFRRKLLIIVTLTVFLSVAGVALAVLAVTRSAFEKTEDQQTTALVTQFQREFDHRGEDVARRVERIAGLDVVIRMAANQADATAYFDLAHSMAESWQLDFLEFLDENGKIVSSAQSPAKFGYPDPSFEHLAGLNQQPAFLKLEELQDSNALGLFAVRATRVGDHPLYVVGGKRLDKDFLSALDLPPGMRVLLYENRTQHFAAESLLDPAARDASHPAGKFAPLGRSGAALRSRDDRVVKWSADAADEEVFHAIPLRGVGKDRPLLGILLIGNSRAAYVELKRTIRNSALLVGGAGNFSCGLAEQLGSGRVTRPVEQLARAARDVAGGNWNSQVEVTGKDEIGQLAESFNRMTTELLAQKERLVQTERVAAWRELARRLAHELKNPLFPLQLTVENLVRARDAGSGAVRGSIPRKREHAAGGDFELEADHWALQRIFEDAAARSCRRCRLNEMVRGVAQLFQAQLQAPGRKAITCRLDLDENVESIEADPELLASGGLQSCAERDGRDARGRYTHIAHSWRPSESFYRGIRHRFWNDSRGVRTDFHSVLHEQTAWHWTGTGDCAVGNQRSWRQSQRAKRPGRGSAFVIELPVKRLQNVHHRGRRKAREQENGGEKSSSIDC